MFQLINCLFVDLCADLNLSINTRIEQDLIGNKYSIYFLFYG